MKVNIAVPSNLLSKSDTANSGLHNGNFEALLAGKNANESDKMLSSFGTTKHLEQTTETFLNALKEGAVNMSSETYNLSSESVNLATGLGVNFLVEQTANENWNDNSAQQGRVNEQYGLAALVSTMPGKLTVQADDTLNSSQTGQLQARVLPFSGISSGYLSYLQDTNSSFTQLNEANPFTKTDVDGASQRLTNHRLEPLQQPAFAVSAQWSFSGQTFVNQANSITQRVEIMAKQVGLGALPHDLEKRHFLLTENSNGNSFWYRDFRVTEQDKLALQQRLESSEFVKLNDIANFYLNGNLLWTNREITND